MNKMNFGLKHILKIYLLFFCLTSPQLFSQEQGPARNFASYPLKSEKRLINKNIYFEYIENPSISKEQFEQYFDIENKNDFVLFKLVNNLKNFELTYQDGSLFVIQEAIDKDGIWNPIEYWQYSWCGNSYEKNKFKKGQFVFIALKKTDGVIENRIRLKFVSNGEIYYSEPFNGKINPLSLGKRKLTENQSY